jgi:DNA-binding transcriptional regulator YdaS (Cro superfamily)
MGATNEGRPRAVKEQAADILRKATQIAGGRTELARRLGVEPHLIAEWTACISDCPDEVVKRAAEIVVGLPPAN